jgi:hypothetical protein
VQTRDRRTYADVRCIHVRSHDTRLLLLSSLRVRVRAQMVRTYRRRSVEAAARGGVRAARRVRDEFGGEAEARRAPFSSEDTRDRARYANALAASMHQRQEQ